MEILVHYLAAVNEGSAVIPGDASGQSVNIRWHQKIKIKDLRYFNFLHSFRFEAQPKPTATWFVKGDQEISISVESDEQRRQNYVVYPLEKVII